MVISGGEFFGRTLKHTSIRAEVDDLRLADMGVQVVTCQRVEPDFVEGMLESLCDSWRETLGRRQQRDMERVLSDSPGPVLLLAVMQGSAKVMRVRCLFNETRRRRRRWRDWKSLSGDDVRSPFP